MFERNLWLKQLFNSWLEGLAEPDGETSLVNELLDSLSSLVERRQQFVKILVEIPEPFACFEDIQEALNNLTNSKRAFSIFSFGNKEAKSIIEQARIEGEAPKDTEMWQSILDYVNYQDDIRKFIRKWNHAGQELELPEFEYRYGSLFKDVQSTHKLISDARS